MTDELDRRLDDLGPIDSHPFQPAIRDEEQCGYVEGGEACGWPERDHLTSERPGYQPDAAYHRMLRGKR